MYRFDTQMIAKVGRYGDRHGTGKKQANLTIGIVFKTPGIALLRSCPKLCLSPSLPIKNNHLYVVVEDKDGARKLAKYKVVLP